MWNSPTVWAATDALLVATAMAALLLGWPWVAGLLMAVGSLNAWRRERRVK